MKPLKFSPDILKQLNQIQKRDRKLYKQILKQLNLLQQNPKLKSLRLHRITREVKNTWSISINKNYRMIYTETDEASYFYDIGTHDEVYRKK
ncbi:MAG: type II toxin-antitoxin system mRNA interferase toxin, RelE/StbE family [Candidatus Daviesbacteria bacterium]|nr:type II toxin-antitoxin system mRNA interferase toxin, RelE/StbE family [Candidatus Daviesbacteria bacterium]